MADYVLKTKAPNLPIPTIQYSQTQLETFNNALRLYFNTLDAFTSNINNTIGAAGLKLPAVAASDSTTQYATVVSGSANNIPTIVAWNTLDFANGFTLNANNTATATYSGTYKITYSLQFANSDNTSDIDVVVWLRVNGNTSTQDVPGSATIFTIPKGKSTTVSSYICGYSEAVFTLNAGDYVGLWWGSATAAISGGAKGTYIHAEAAATTPMAYPSVPSAIGSITFVSAA